MARRRDKRPKPRRPLRKRIWACGRVLLPGYVMDGEPYRPDVILCVERAEGVVVGYGLTQRDGGGPDELDVLTKAIEAPLIGPPRTPDKIFVAEEALARVLSDALEIEVVVGSVPELDRIAQAMFEHGQALGDEGDMSYLQGGRVSAGAIAQLFEAACALYELAPWESREDSDVIEIDIPSLRVQGARVSIIGALGESEGFLLFPSRDAHEAFLAVAEQGPSTHGPMNLGTSFLSLNYDRCADLPPSMRKEIAKHRWPVAAPTGYPWLQHRDRDGLLRPLNERDVLTATLCARALAAFAESSEGGGDLELSDTFHDHEVRVRVAGFDDELQRHDLDGALVNVLRAYAHERFGDRWHRQHAIFQDADQIAQLSNPLSVYGFEVDGRSIAEWFVDEHGHQVGPSEHAWLEAQQRSWLSLWEVIEVIPGEAMTLIDLLTRQRRQVIEVRASRGLQQHEGILARVVDTGGEYLICGVHPQPLGPRDLSGVVDAVRAYLRKRGPVPPERLQNFKVVRALVKQWETAAASAQGRAQRPPELCNTDGEPLLLTTDHFRYGSGGSGEVEAVLSDAKDFTSPEPGGARVYRLCREGNAKNPGLNSTLIALLRVEPKRLTVETNSLARADAVRERIETLLDERVIHQAREHTDPTSEPVLKQMRRKPPTQQPPTAEMQRALLAFKAEQYRDWIDQPLPALGGKTARQSVATRQGARAVNLLLKEMEHHEARIAPEERYDFSILRRQLGL